MWLHLNTSKPLFWYAAQLLQPVSIRYKIILFANIIIQYQSKIWTHLLLITFYIITIFHIFDFF